MKDPLENKIILLTGGTGLYGQKFVETALAHYHPKKIRIYSRNEYLQYQMERKFNDKRLRYFIGDVRDKDRLSLAMTDVDIVIHAAALKHVPICEYNPIEAINTNINGMINIANCALDHKVNKVMFISSDKAVYSINLYGATKSVAEKLCIQSNVYGKTRFAVSRYGNVVGSRGSVIPLFQEQKLTGELTLTNPEMTRFWITLDDGVEFSIKNLGRMKGGEIFVPKIPSMKVKDIAKAIAPEAKIKIIGLRPGEKIHETLITEEESIRTTIFKNYFMINPEFRYWERDEVLNRLRTKPFIYSSDNNTKWLSIEELQKLI